MLNIFNEFMTLSKLVSGQLPFLGVRRTGRNQLVEEGTTQINIGKSVS
jgi:hypothetical protein